MAIPKTYRVVESPRWLDEQHTSLSAVVDGRQLTLSASTDAKSLYASVLESIAHDALTIAEYSLPRESALSRVQKLITESDQRTLQRLRYIRGGESTDTVDARIAEIDAEIAALQADYDYNDSTGKYHLQTCQYADGTDLKTLDELAALGAAPCAVCSPPAVD